MKEYVPLDETDAMVLRSLGDIVGPHHRQIVRHACARLLDHLHLPFSDRLASTLEAWIEGGLAGPHDATFDAHCAATARQSLHTGVPYPYLVTTVDGIRRDIRQVLQAAFSSDVTRFVIAADALDRLFTLGLGLVLETYRNDADDRLRRTERLATLGQLAAGVAHDLRNPLGVIESSLFILRRRLADDAGSKRHLEKMAKVVQVCERIVTDLLDLARDDHPKVQTLDLDRVVEQALRAVEIPPSIQVETTWERGLQLDAGPGLLQQALINVIQNAVRALASGPGHIRIRARAEGGEVCLDVSDDGAGFDPAILPIAFEPLVTTQADGTGLGLALVRSIVELHQGRVHACNLPDGGARVTLCIPQRGPQ